MGIEDDLLHDLIQECAQDSPGTARSVCLRRAVELKNLLMSLDQDWARSQRRFYSAGLILFGSGTNFRPGPSSGLGIRIEGWDAEDEPQIGS